MWGTRDGWFENIRKIISGFAQERAQTTPLADEKTRFGVLAPAVYAMVCDGEQQPAEKLLLFATLMTSPIFEGVKPEDFFKQVDEIDARLDMTDKEAVKKTVKDAVEPLTRPLRQTAYAFAVRMIYADKTLNVAEIFVQDNLHTWLELDESTARKIRETMAICARHPME